MWARSCVPKRKCWELRSLNLELKQISHRVGTKYFRSHALCELCVVQAPLRQVQHALKHILDRLVTVRLYGVDRRCKHVHALVCVD